MTQPLTTGEKNRRANIRAMKAIGAKNAKTRAKTVAANVAKHLARNEDRRILAIIDRADRIAAGQAKRDAHNQALKDAARFRREVRTVAAAFTAQFPDAGTDGALWTDIADYFAVNDDAPRPAKAA